MNSPRALSWTDAVLPLHGIRTTGLLVAFASLLLALSARVAIPLPFSPVPISGQSFAVLLVGALLGSRRGSAAVLLYLAEGAVGLPVFAGGAGGAAYLVGPTGGYLAAFLPAAFVVGALCERGWDKRVPGAAAAMAIGSIVLLAGGASWLARFVGVEAALRLGVLPFLPGDVLKIALAAVALPSGRRVVGRAAGRRS